jgi:hypothetical protein
LWNFVRPSATGHSRHDTENQEVEISGFEYRKLLAAIACDHNGVTGPLTVIIIGLIVENLIFRTIERNTVQKWGTQS